MSITWFVVVSFRNTNWTCVFQIDRPFKIWLSYRVHLREFLEMHLRIISFLVMILVKWYSVSAASSQMQRKTEKLWCCLDWHSFSSALSSLIILPDSFHFWGKVQVSYERYILKVKRQREQAGKSREVLRWQIFPFFHRFLYIYLHIHVSSEGYIPVIKHRHFVEWKFEVSIIAFKKVAVMWRPTYLNFFWYFCLKSTNRGWASVICVRFYIIFIWYHV